MCFKQLFKLLSLPKKLLSNGRSTFDLIAPGNPDATAGSRLSGQTARAQLLAVVWNIVPAADFFTDHTPVAQGKAQRRKAGLMRALSGQLPLDPWHPLLGWLKIHCLAYSRKSREPTGQPKEINPVSEGFVHCQRRSEYRDL